MEYINTYCYIINDISSVALKQLYTKIIQFNLHQDISFNFLKANPAKINISKLWSSTQNKNSGNRARACFDRIIRVITAHSTFSLRIFFLSGHVKVLVLINKACTNKNNGFGSSLRSTCSSRMQLLQFYIIFRPTQKGYRFPHGTSTIRHP